MKNNLITAVLTRLKIKFSRNTTKSNLREHLFQSHSGQNDSNKGAKMQKRRLLQNNRRETKKKSLKTFLHTICHQQTKRFKRIWVYRQSLNKNDCTIILQKTNHFWNNRVCYSPFTSNLKVLATVNYHKPAIQ